MCPGDPKLTQCNMDCANGTDPTPADCWFLSCGVMTGFCDNEERGDPSILLCGLDRGWYSGATACSNLMSGCDFCPTPDETNACRAIATAGNPRNCIRAQQSMPGCY